MSHDIRVSSAILKANLSPGNKMIYVGIRSRQGANEWCIASQRQLANDMGCNKSTINRAIQILINEGWVTKHENGRYLKCLSTPFGSDYMPSESVRKKRTERTQKAYNKDDIACTQKINSVYAKNQLGVRKKSPPSENQHIKPTIKTNTLSAGISDKEKTKTEKPPPSWCADDWQLQYAETFAERLAEADCLDKGIMRKTNSDRAKVMQNWADVFDKIHRLDGYPIKEISSLISWLFHKGNWWIETKNIRTATKLRKTNSDGERYFDIMVRRMEAKHQRRGSAFDSFDAIPTYGGVT